MFWKDKRVIVTGSNGLIGKELVLLLHDLGCDVLEFDIKRTYTSYNNDDNFERAPMDIRNYNLVKSIFENYRPHYVFHLFGIKGNPKMTNEKPVDFMLPMIQGDSNIIRACIEFNVERMFYTSSIAVENPETDKYPAWAKQTAEKLIEACRIQYPDKTKFCIGRPANVYGRFDDFNKEHLMVVSDLIKKCENSNNIQIWGDGNNIRDFINAKDVARAMILIMEKLPEEPIPICSGKGNTVNELLSFILDSKDMTDAKITYDKTKPTGHKAKIMDNTKLKELGFEYEYDLQKGIKEVIEWRNQSVL